MYRLRLDDDLLFEFQGQGYMSHGGCGKPYALSGLALDSGTASLLDFSYSLIGTEKEFIVTKEPTTGLKPRINFRPLTRPS